MIERFGDYDAWFRRALEPAGVDCAVYDTASTESLPSPHAADGWIITGARASVMDGGPAVERLLDWIRETVGQGTPLLGVCYGHQAVCAATGGKVERHPAGWELGTVEVELTPAGRADPIFEGFPDRFLVQTTHEDAVIGLPPRATLLAGNAHCPVQAVAIGPACRGVQFHPEVTAPIARDFVARRAHLVQPPPVVADAPHAARVLVNFARAFVEAGSRAGR